MTKSFELEVISPDGIVFSASVIKLVAVSDIGEFCILYDHASLTSKLEIAPVRYETVDGGQGAIAVIEGVLEFKKNKAIIITDYAEAGEKINETQARKAEEEARVELNLLKERDTQDKDLLLAEYKLKRELTRLKTLRLNKI
jgi:F-type H+-transporting ATPase subunit epsilon